MGWLYSDQSKKEMIAEVTQGHENIKTGVKTTCIAKAIRGKNLWTVFEQTSPAYSPQAFNVKRFIVLFIMEKADGMWGYKDISEDMGPADLDCPLKYLDMVTAPTNEYSREWRIRVRQNHYALRIPKLAPGDTIRLRLGLAPRDHKLARKYTRSPSWRSTEGITLTPSVLRGCFIIEKGRK